MRSPSFRIMRRAGSRLVDVPHPLMPDIDGLSLHAPDAATAVANAKRLGITGALVALSESN